MVAKLDNCLLFSQVKNGGKLSDLGIESPGEKENTNDGICRDKSTKCFSKCIPNMYFLSARKLSCMLWTNQKTFSQFLYRLGLGNRVDTYQKKACNNCPYKLLAKWEFVLTFSPTCLSICNHNAYILSKGKTGMRHLAIICCMFLHHNLLESPPIHLAIVHY